MVIGWGGAIRGGIGPGRTWACPSSPGRGTGIDGWPDATGCPGMAGCDALGGGPSAACGVPGFGVPGCPVYGSYPEVMNGRLP
ncbi:hypothetical protein GCM10027280_04420 [Micromonospora polyrhachis]